MNSGRDRESVKDVRGNGVVASHVSSRKGKGNRRTTCVSAGRDLAMERAESWAVDGNREGVRRKIHEGIWEGPRWMRERGGESGRGVRGAEEERKLGGGGNRGFPARGRGSRKRGAGEGEDDESDGQIAGRKIGRGGEKCSSRKPWG